MLSTSLSISPSRNSITTESRYASAISQRSQKIHWLRSEILLDFNEAHLCDLKETLLSLCQLFSKIYIRKSRKLINTDRTLFSLLCLFYASKNSTSLPAITQKGTKSSHSPWTTLSLALNPSLSSLFLHLFNWEIFITLKYVTLIEIKTDECTHHKWNHGNIPWEYTLALKVWKRNRNY